MDPYTAWTAEREALLGAFQNYPPFPSSETVQGSAPKALPAAQPRVSPAIGPSHLRVRLVPVSPS